MIGTGDTSGGYRDGDAEVLAEHARVKFDDGAYLLGALDEEQSQAYRHHLMRCPLCRQQAAELAVLPAVLARADVSAWHPQAPPDTLLPRLLRQVAASRRRRTWRTAALGMAAACLVALPATGGVLGWQYAHRPQTLAMQSVGPNSAAVHATVQLVSSGAGTRVKLDCGYSAARAAYPAGGAPSYRMVIFNRRGQMADLGSWTPQPDEDVQIARTSPWTRQNISRIEVSDARGQTVLRLSL